jgi:hypothetical protein
MRNKRRMLIEEFHAHLIRIDTFECLAELVEGDRSISIFILEQRRSRWNRSDPSKGIYQFSDGVISNGRYLIVVNVSTDHHFQHLQQFLTIDLQIMISIVHLNREANLSLSLTIDRWAYVEEKTKFLFACVEFGDGRFDFALSEFGQEKDELFKVQFIILAVIVHDDIDQSFAQWIDVHFGNAKKIFACQITTITFVQGFESTVQPFDLLASEAYDDEQTDDLSLPPSSTSSSTTAPYLLDGYMCFSFSLSLFCVRPEIF